MAKHFMFCQTDILRCLCNWIAVCCLALGLTAGAAQVAFAANDEVRLYRQEDHLVLSANVPVELPPSVEGALQKGVPIYFLLEAELTRDRWYWFDKRIVSTARHIRLMYQPITRKWKINIGTENMRAADAGMTLSQSFDNFEDAVNTIARIRAWPVVATAELDPEARYVLTFRFQLDTAALPKPLQIGLIGQSDWNVDFSKSIRLTPEIWR